MNNYKKLGSKLWMNLVRMFFVRFIFGIGLFLFMVFLILKPELGSVGRIMSLFVIFLSGFFSFLVGFWKLRGTWHEKVRNNQILKDLFIRSGIFYLLVSIVILVSLGIYLIKADIMK